jgi:hypothetical protein
MPTKPYHTSDGKRVPGVTTVIGANCAWNKDALMRWANKLGREEGKTLDEARLVSGGAADIGTMVHEWVEAHILDAEPPRSATSFSTEQLLQIESAKNAFKSWYSGSNLTVLATECWGVDEEYRTGFCADALFLEADGGVTLGDWKTSKGTYADHVVQTAAYMIFVERLMVDWLGGVELKGAHVIRFDKDSGMFSHKFWPRAALMEAWHAFTWLRALHDVRWRVEALTR